jgi:type I restriction enzyme S subunit
MSEATRNDWVVQPLGELAEARRGITYSSAMLESQEEGLPYVNMKSFLKGGGFNTDGTKRYAGIYGQNDLVGERDLLIANTDVTAGDIVGVPALLPHELSANKLLYSHHVTRLRLTSWVTVPFLYYLLCLPEYRSHMLRIARGTTVLMLDMHAIKRIPIRAPEAKAEQDRIAEILSTLDEAIEQTKALIAKHQQIKAGLMHDLFTRGVTPDGHLRPTHDQAPDLYKESPLGWIPREWDVKLLGALAEIVSGVTLGAKGEISDEVGVPYLRVANVQDGYFDLTEVKTIHVSRSQFEKLQLRYGDVLMNEGGDFDKLGRGSVWLEEIKPCIHQNHVFRVRPRDSKLRSYYLAFWSQSEMGKKYFVLNSKQSTNLASINSTQLNRFPVALPSSIEQERIETRIVELNSYADSLEQEHAKLRQQKNGLMHDLLTGRVRVKFSEKRDTRG